MKVGDYVRTNLGRIAKITKVIDCKEEGEKPYLNYNDMCVYTIDENFKVAGSRGEIVKSSSNLIDLIEVGDYVNGEEVEWVGKFKEDDTQNICHIETGFVFNNSVKSIVTHEQFESMEYKIC